MDKHEWYFNPGTVEFMAKLEADLAGVKDDWANGAFTSSSEHETVQLNAKALGYINAVTDILEWIRSDDEGGKEKVEGDGIPGADSA